MRQLLRRVWYAIREQRHEADLAEEMDFHREMKQRELEARGVEPTEAAFATRRALGSLALARDRSRDVWRPRWSQGAGQDLRLAVRALRATPIVSIVAVLSLALGIGANTAIFSLVNSLLLRTLPAREPDRLVLVADSAVQYFSHPVWEQIRQRPELFESAGACLPTRFNLAASGETEFVDGVWASGSYLDMLGVRAALGRVFSTEDDRQGGGAGGPVTVISYGFWQRRFGGTPDVIGRRLSLNGVPVSIIGVTPPDFFGTDVGRRFDVMLPVADEPLVNGRDSLLNGGGLGLMIFGRLKPGQTRESATAALRAAQPAIRDATVRRTADASNEDPHLRDYLKSPFTLVPAATGSSEFRGRYVRPLVMILSAAGLVLLVACANVANLLLARAAARRHEMSVRVALGASRWRLVRSLLVESVLLAGMAAGLGMLIASWGSRLLVHHLSTQTGPVFLDLSLDWRLLAFAIVVAIATLLLFGVVPAVRASRVAPMEALKAHGRGTAGEGRIGLAGGLVVAQVALSVVLVVAGGLFVRTFASLVTRDPGFARNDVLLVLIESRRAGVDPEQRIAVYGHVREAVRAVPGVADAALSDLTPVSNIAFDPPVDVSGSGPLSRRERIVFGNVISPGWFNTFRIPLVAGRDLTHDDRVGAPPVAVVNRAFARKFLKGASPLDHTITLPAAMTEPSPNPPLRIVGVVADAVYLSLRESPRATMYLPLEQHDEPFFARALGSVSLNVRSNSGSPARLTKSVVAAIASVNPSLAVTVRPLADQVNDSLARERVLAMLAGFFGVLALLLAGLGLYGVTAYAVARRRTEIGIRMALGAAPARVLRMVLSSVAVLVGFGAVVGALVSLSASRLVVSLLYGVEPRDPATLIGAVITLATVGAFAGWLPAWRASRIDPALVLREQ
jgi:putative ABC transport system permease protein